MKFRRKDMMEHTNRHRSFYCKHTNKKCYSSKGDAEKAMQGVMFAEFYRGSGDMSAYYCKACNRWHFGHMSDWQREQARRIDCQKRRQAIMKAQKNVMWYCITPSRDGGSR